MPRRTPKWRRLSRSAPLDLTGTLSIIESAAVLKRCRALVTNDSAPLHLAEAVGTPVDRLLRPDGARVRLFSAAPRAAGRSKRRSRAAPARETASARCPYGTKECLTSIEPATALEALLETLGETRGHS